MEKHKNYLVLSYYVITPIEHPEQEVKKHKEFFKDRDVAGRIYISKNGINGQMSGFKSDADAYASWMKEQPLFQEISFRVVPYHENILAKITVKVRDQLVALDEHVDYNKRGHYLSPKEWKETLDSDEDYVLIDVRNDYEWAVGHFEGAELPACNTFREFNAYADRLKEAHNAKETKVLMYCTGGIRCELYSALLKEEGFDNVYQLQGGVVNYGIKEGRKHWEGKLFVFDDRMTIPISDEKSSVVAQCHHCQESSDHYYNCANMDCNYLFICCQNCLEKHQGCCQNACMSAARIRPFDQVGSKPFRKWYHYYDDKPSVIPSA